MGKTEKKDTQNTPSSHAEILNGLWTISRNYNFMCGLTAGHCLKGRVPASPVTEHFTFTYIVPANPVFPYEYVQHVKNQLFPLFLARQSVHFPSE